MCKKLHYCAKKVDPCIAEAVEAFNDLRAPKFKSFSCCCGHGVYPATLVVMNVYSGSLFEWTTGTSLRTKVEIRGKKKQFIRIYVKDINGYYYIPEVMDLYRRAEVTPPLLPVCSVTPFSVFLGYPEVWTLSSKLDR